jgi:hypothetical protein
MKYLFSDRTNLDGSLHGAAALNRMQACHYCLILLWNQLHVAFDTVAECITVSERLALSFFRINIIFLLRYDVTLTFPSRLMPIFFSNSQSTFFLQHDVISQKIIIFMQNAMTNSNHILLSSLWSTGRRVISSCIVDIMEQPSTLESLKTCRHIHPLKTKRRPLYLKTQSVPRCKHFSSRL